jgi:hypothetical protein
VTVSCGLFVDIWQATRCCVLSVSQVLCEAGWLVVVLVGGAV